MAKGRLPQPDSVRGLRATGGVITENIQDDLYPPDWLTLPERKYFRELIDQQRAAGVGMRSVDAEIYARYVHLALLCRKEKEPRKYLAIQRGIFPLYAILGIGEASRQRLGVRGKKPKEKGKLAIMLEQRRSADLRKGNPND